MKTTRITKIPTMGPIILDRNKQVVQFNVFAHRKNKVELVYQEPDGIEKSTPMEETAPHYFSINLEGVNLHGRYGFKLDGKGPFPDPWSHFQPEGVHGLSQLVDHQSYKWREEGWKGLELKELIIYEIHVGTFSKKGNFKGVAEKLDYLCELGINTVELMPVNQTPGRWNWGYDGTGLFSVNYNYGTPGDLKHLVDQCHRKGLAVILDVVYNHFGPEGNYLHQFGPYFTGKHVTPWGDAVNFDDDYCEVVRQMVAGNVKYWLDAYRFDGLRLDAVHAIEDNSTPHLLQEISETANQSAWEWGRHKWVIAETDENDARIITPQENGGYGVHAQWMDDFHHCVHTALTGEKRGYYADYGKFKDLEKVFFNYLYTGQYSLFWKKPRGTNGFHIPGYQFVVAVQTHDQVGNRAAGERLSLLVDFPFLKTAAALPFLSPYLPLLFMGEEYGEENPFLFFTDYGDPELQDSVARGRRNEFKDFGWKEVPNPQEEETFYSSKLTELNHWKKHQQYLFEFYRDMIELRRHHPALREPDKEKTRVKADPLSQVMEITRRSEKGTVIVASCNLGEKTLVLPHHSGKVILSSEWDKYGGDKKQNSSSRLLQKGEVLLREE